MLHWKTEKYGAALGIATGLVGLSLAIASIFLLIFGVSEFGGTRAIMPLIGPGWTSIMYAMSIVVSGLLGLFWPLFGGIALVLCSIFGILFGTSKYPAVESFSLLAGLICLLGWWNNRARRGS